MSPVNLSLELKKQKIALIHRTLYGGKSAKKRFQRPPLLMHATSQFVSCLADPIYGWDQLSKTKITISSYFYTNNCLALSENAEHILHHEFGWYFMLKEKSIGAPKMCLGGSMRKVQQGNRVGYWIFSSSQYVQATVKNIKEYLSTWTADK